jgi:hypothetical protein
MKMENKKWRLIFSAGLSILVLAGCKSIGSRTLGPDRLGYIQDLSDSWKKQMLLNIVKLRYFDPPTFLDVTSIINQYGMENQVDANMAWNWPMPATPSRVAGIGGYSRYSDKPTITYMPLSGQKFTKSLLTPIAPVAVVTLMQNGWPIDMVFALMVKTVNGVNNGTKMGSDSAVSNVDFQNLVQALRIIQLAGVSDIRLEKTGETEAVVFVISDAVEKEKYREQTETIRNILKLKPGADKYRIVFGTLPQTNEEIALMTRSMMEMMLKIAETVDVPAQHVAKKRVKETVPFSSEKWATQIHSSRDKPKDAFTAIQYAEHWFWIDNKDISSKRNFALLMIFMSLTESEQKTGAPLFSIGG